MTVRECLTAWKMKLVLRVGRRNAHLVLLFLTVFVVCLTFQLALVIVEYHEYLEALLPQAHLPLQLRAEEEEGPGRLFSRKEGGLRILCLIVTAPKYHQTRAVHVAATWARHCTRAVFLTGSPDPALPEVILTPHHDTYDTLWEKVIKGLEWAYERRAEFDWVVKADDDTFLLVENLEAALLSLDPAQPLATGLQLNTWDGKTTYMNGGASYTLSRGALIKLVEDGVRSGHCSRSAINLIKAEDINMCVCLGHLGVEVLDSRDAAGRQRFHMYPPTAVVDPRQENSFHRLFLKKISRFPYKFGYSHLSDQVISFHYVDAETMYLTYYLVYLVNPVSSRRAPHHPAAFQYVKP